VLKQVHGQSEGVLSERQHHVPGVHDESSLGFGEIPHEGLDAIGHSRPRCGRELGFDGDKATAVLNDEVHFRADRCAPEIHARLLPPIDLSLDQLTEHNTFEKRSSERTAQGLLLRLDTRQITPERGYRVL
jgi:hypothetical protein